MAETNGEPQIVTALRSLEKELNKEGLRHARRSKRHVTWSSLFLNGPIALGNLILFIWVSGPVRYANLIAALFITAVGVIIWRKRSWWDKKIEWWEGRVNG